MGLGIGVNVTVYSIAREMRMAAGFVGSMSGVGLLLALSGLYSSVSYATKGARGKWRFVSRWERLAPGSFGRQFATASRFWRAELQWGFRWRLR